MTTHPCLPSRNEDYGFFGTMTRCPERDRRSAEVWMLASRLIAEAIRAACEDEMIGIRDFLDSRMGRQFADDVTGRLCAGKPNLEIAITATIQRWQSWRISHRTEREDNIPAGLPYLTGWMQHFAVSAEQRETTQ